MIQKIRHFMIEFLYKIIMLLCQEETLSDIEKASRNDREIKTGSVILLNLFYAIAKFSQMGAMISQSLSNTYVGKEQTSAIRYYLNSILEIITEAERIADQVEVDAGIRERIPTTVEELIVDDKKIINTPPDSNGFHPLAKSIDDKELHTLLDGFSKRN